MKTYISLLLTLVLSCFASTSFAYTPPAPTGFVTDTMGVMNAGQVKALNSKISAMKASTKNEVGILVIPTIGDESIEDVTHDTFKAWKVGAAGLDNGVLIVIAVNSHRMRIQTGKGVEGDLPDILTADIQTKMKPFMRSNDVAGALNVAVDNISAKLESRKGQKADDAGVGAQFNKPLPVTPSTETSATNPVPRSASCDASGAGVPTTGGSSMFIVLMLVTGVLFGYFYSRSKRQAREREEAENLERNRKLAAANARREQAAADERALHAARKLRAEELEAQRAAEAQTLPRVYAAPPVPAPTRKATTEDLKKVLVDRATKQVYVPTVPRPTSRPLKDYVGPSTTVATVATATLATELAAQRLRDEQEQVERERERERARARREREAEEASLREHQEAESRRERERQEREYEAQLRRQRDEDERRARQEREEEIAAAAIAAAAVAAAAYSSYSSSDSSSSSSSSSYDSGSSSSSWDSGSSSSDSGFGGGDSGGGGSSSDW